MSGASTAVPAFNNNPPAVVRGATVVADYETFMRETQEMVKRLGIFGTNLPADPWAEPLNIPQPKYGIAKKSVYLCTATFTTAKGTGAVTLADTFPFGFVGRVEHKGNNSDIHTLKGISLHARRQRRNRLADPTGTWHDLDGLTAGAAIGTDATYVVKFMLELPHCYDYATGVGAQYSEANGASFETVLKLCSKADMFTLTGTAAVTAFTFTAEEVHTWWTLPRKNVNGVETMYVPDMSRLFQLIDRTESITAQGEQAIELNKSAGNCQCVTVAYRNNGAAVAISGGGLDTIGWNYAGNETPKLWDPPEVLLAENADHYGGILPFKMAALDFEYENPRRDAVVPRNVSSLNVQLGIPQATTLVSATATLTQEFLIGASNAPAIEAA